MYAAVIVETRILPNLKEIIDGHMSRLPRGWDLVIYHGSANEKAMRAAAEHIKTVMFVNMHLHGMSIREYNQLLTNRVFWLNLCKYERVLIFQTDSMLLRKGIEEFLEWDYVGAPWEWQDHGGNGGLSIRNPHVMGKIVSTFQWNGDNEDTFFSNLLNDKPIFGRLAPRGVAKRFSCETIFNLGTLGYHAADKYMTKEQFNQIKTQYDEITTGKV